VNAAGTGTQSALSTATRTFDVNTTNVGTQPTAVSADDTFISLAIEEKQTLGGTHKVMLMFGAQDYQLRQWTVTDPQGYDTTVAVYNLDNTKAPAPNMFR